MLGRFFRAVAIACTMARFARALEVASYSVCSKGADMTSPVDIFDKCSDVAPFVPGVVWEIKHPRISGLLCFVVGLISVARHGVANVERVAKKFIEGAGT